jgi:hypothetical protein
MGPVVGQTGTTERRHVHDPMFSSGFSRTVPLKSVAMRPGTTFLP